MSHTDFLLLGYGIPALLLLAELMVLVQQRRHEAQAHGDAWSSGSEDADLDGDWDGDGDLADTAWTSGPSTEESSP